LDFRQFILCLAVCTKNKLKERIKAILKAYRDEADLVTFENFEKLIKHFGEISDEKIFRGKKM
jgi:hypothetical protein